MSTRVLIGVVLLAALSLASGSRLVETPGADPGGTAALPYLVYVSDRDGDYDVYAARADGTRTVQISRDRRDHGASALSADGRWIASWEVGGRLTLMSTDGRHVRVLGNGLEEASVTFSRDGRFLAYGAERSADNPRAMLVPTAGGRPRFVGRGRPESFSPDGRFLAIDDWSTGRLRIAKVSDGARRTLVAGRFRAAGWSPDGEWYAFTREGAAHVVRVRSPRAQPRMVLRGRGLDELDWLHDRRLSYVLRDEDRGSVEIGTVTVDRRRTVVAEHTGNFFASPEWYDDGSRLVYVERVKDLYLLVTRASTGRGRRVLLRSRSIGAVAWTPDANLVVVYERAGRSVVGLVDRRGRKQAVLRDEVSSVSFGEWSRDRRFLDLAFQDVNEVDGVAVLSLRDRRVRRFTTEGNVRPIGWAEPDVGPADAAPPAALPPFETGAGRRLSSLGRIEEISASGNWVGAMVDDSARDCEHVLAWRHGRADVVRFRRPRRCPSSGDGYLVRVFLEGARLTWTGVTFGNYSYWKTYAVDVRRPQAGIRVIADDAGDHGDEPGRPAPEPGDRRGVTMVVRNGTVLLTRRSDGATRTIDPGARVIDAELENAGLFYAFNSGGRMRGHIVFVPFAELLG